MSAVIRDGLIFLFLGHLVTFVIYISFDFIGKVSTYIHDSVFFDAILFMMKRKCVTERIMHNVYYIDSVSMNLFILILMFIIFYTDVCILLEDEIGDAYRQKFCDNISNIFRYFCYFPVSVNLWPLHLICMDDILWGTKGNFWKYYGKIPYDSYVPIFYYIDILYFRKKIE